MSLFAPKSVQRYTHFRHVSRGLPSKVFAATRELPFDIFKAAKKLGIPVNGRTLIFDDETDQNALMDFCLHELRPNERSMVECCDLDAMGLSPDERDLLSAHCAGRTSLFDIVATDAGEAHVQLRDLLSPEQPDILLSDRSMSATRDVAGRVLIFLRVVTCQEIAMTSGCFFSYSPRHRQRLLGGYEKRKKSAPAHRLAEHRFVYFYQRYREFGEGQATAEAV